MINIARFPYKRIVPIYIPTVSCHLFHHFNTSVFKSQPISPELNKVTQFLYFMCLWLQVKTNIFHMLIGLLYLLILKCVRDYPVLSPFMCRGMPFSYWWRKLFIYEKWQLLLTYVAFVLFCNLHFTFHFCLRCFSMCRSFNHLGWSNLAMYFLQLYYKKKIINPTPKLFLNVFFWFFQILLFMFCCLINLLVTLNLQGATMSFLTSLTW